MLLRNACRAGRSWFPGNPDQRPSRSGFESHQNFPGPDLTRHPITGQQLQPVSSRDFIHHETSNYILPVRVLALQAEVVDPFEFQNHHDLMLPNKVPLAVSLVTGYRRPEAESR